MHIVGSNVFDLFPIEEKLAFVEWVDAGDSFDKGGFASAVFTHKSANFPFFQGEIDIVQGVDAGKRLVDAFCLEYDSIQGFLQTIAEPAPPSPQPCFRQTRLERWGGSRRSAFNVPPAGGLFITPPTGR